MAEGGCFPCDGPLILIETFGLLDVPVLVPPSGNDLGDDEPLTPPILSLSFVPPPSFLEATSCNAFLFFFVGKSIPPIPELRFPPSPFPVTSGTDDCCCCSCSSFLSQFFRSRCATFNISLASLAIHLESRPAWYAMAFSKMVKQS